MGQNTKAAAHTKPVLPVCSIATLPAACLIPTDTPATCSNPPEQPTSTTSTAAAAASATSTSRRLCRSSRRGAGSQFCVASAMLQLQLLLQLPLHLLLQLLKLPNSTLIILRRTGPAGLVH